MVRFGPFAIDIRTWTLTRNAESVDLSPRLVEILAHLAARPGEIVTKDELLDRFWPDTHVTENTLTRAIADIRKAMDDHAEHPQYIQTLARRGYRFIGAATAPADAAAPTGDPLRQWVEGRLALESLDQSRLALALERFSEAASAMPAYAPAHAGVANAHLVRFEITRQRNVPDRATLELAVASARQACALDPQLGEAWAVLAHALTLAGRSEDAQAAARRAIALEPGSWRHHFRLALASWGEERLREVDRTLALMPASAAAHLLSAMVFVARGALDRAHLAASAGAGLQSRQPESASLPAAGLHWMSGLVHLARADSTEAAACFRREVESAAPGRVYAREFVLNARIAEGFLLSASNERSAAAQAFRDVLDLEPGHARATLGQALSGSASEDAVARALAELDSGGKVGERALVGAAALAWRGEHAAAIQILGRVIDASAPGPMGWSLRADPMFLPLRRVDGFERLISAVAARAA